MPGGRSASISLAVRAYGSRHASGTTSSGGHSCIPRAMKTASAASWTSAMSSPSSSFTARSQRARNVLFHPKRRWILQNILFDYVLGDRSAFSPPGPRSRMNASNWSACARIARTAATASDSPVAARARCTSASTSWPRRILAGVSPQSSRNAVQVGSSTATRATRAPTCPGRPGRPRGAAKAMSAAEVVVPLGVYHPVGLMTGRWLVRRFG
jgi:hypothetical protein